MLGLSKTFLTAFVICSLLLVLVPRIDLCASVLFHDPEHGGFPWHDNPAALAVYYAVRWASRVLPALLLVGLAVSLATRKKLLGLEPKAYLYLLLVFVVGIVLMVNVLFKQHWGRARPDQIIDFGGTLKFTRAFVISRQGESHGSWPSGHAAFGFYFFAVAMLLRKRRAIVMVLAGCLGAFIGLMRMIQGRHFLSDVVSAFFIIYIVARVTYYLMYESKLGSRWQWGRTS